MKSLVEKNKKIDFRFIIVDDNSSDGTTEAIKSLEYDTEIIKGSGKLYWCGGMRTGIKRYLELDDKTDCLLINDDVDFYDIAIEKIINQQDQSGNTVIVGATCNSKGEFTYGLRKHRDKKGIWLDPVLPNSDKVNGDTMNANCVLIPYNIMVDVGNLDLVYSHSLGDYDLGFAIKRKGYNLISSNEYVGVCEENGFQNTWRDPNISISQRIKKKESPKGSPFVEWWHFLNKNYNLLTAIKYSLTPYIKIFLKK